MDLVDAVVDLVEGKQICGKRMAPFVCFPQGLVGREDGLVGNRF